MTANAMKYRIKKLELEHIILGYTASLDFHAFGYELYNIQVKLNTLDRDDLLHYLRAHKSVFFFFTDILVMNNGMWTLACLSSPTKIYVPSLLSSKRSSARYSNSMTCILSQTLPKTISPLRVFSDNCSISCFFHRPSFFSSCMQSFSYDCPREFSLDEVVGELFFEYAHVSVHHLFAQTLIFKYHHHA